MTDQKVLTVTAPPARVATTATAVVNFVIIGLFALGVFFALSGAFTLSLLCGVLGLIVSAVFVIMWGGRVKGPLGDIPIIAVLIPIALLLIFTAGMLLAAVLLPSTVGSNSFNTNLSTTATTPGSTVHGILRFNPAGLPPCTQTRTVSGAVVLAIDMSSSMDGDAEAKAKAAAQSFIREVDLTTNRTGIVRFGSQADLVHPLDTDRGSLLSAVDALEASGETAINAALIEANKELQNSQVLTDSQRTIILLSDGGETVVTPAEVQQTARSIQNSGVRIITIGLASTGLNDTLLRSIATSEDDYWPAPGTDELADIYTGIAQNINYTAATNIQVTLPYDRSRFTLDETTIKPPARVTSDTIIWEQDYLRNRVQSFSFDVSPQGIGFLALNDKGLAPTISLTDCNNNPQTFGGADGPTILSAFPLTWLWLPLLLMAIINFILMRIRGSGPSTLKSTVGVHPLSKRVALDYDLQNLNPLIEERYPEEGNTRPVVLIGFGEFGKWTLEQVKRKLVGKYSQLPSNLSMLYVDIQPDTGSAFTTDPSLRTIPTGARLSDVTGEGLRDTEIILLRPNLKELEDAKERERKRLNIWQRDSSYLRWFDGSGGHGGRGRALGRIALFYDMLNGFDRSRLLGRLEQICPAGSRIVLIGALEDNTSSALVDLAALLRHSATRLWNRSIRSIEALLTIPATERLANNHVNAFAAALELERFSYKGRYRFQYSQDSETVVTHDEVSPIDQYYLMDASGTPVELQSTTWAAAAEVVTLVADSALDHTQERDHNDLGGEIGEMRRRGHMAVSGLSLFVQRLPIEELRRVVEAKMLLDGLFTDEHAFAASIEDQLEGWKLLPPDDKAKAQRGEEVKDFLRGMHRSGSLLNQNTFFHVLADALGGDWRDIGMRLSRLGRLDTENLVHVFGWSLEEKGLKLLNHNDPPEDLPARRRGLSAWIAFLESLRSALVTLRKQASESRNAFDVELGHANIVLDVLKQAEDLVKKSKDAALGWQNSLLASRDTLQADAPVSLRETLKGLYERKRSYLNELQQAQHQHLEMDSRAEEELYELVWTAFRSNFLERLGWRPELRDGRITLKLMVVPPAPSIDSPPPSSETYSADEIVDGKVPQTFLRLARAFSSILLTQKQVSMNVDRVRDILTGAVDRHRWLDFDEAAAAEIRSQVERTYLLVPPGAGTSAAAARMSTQIKDIAELELIENPVALPNTNNHQWAVIRETQLVALDVTAAYKRLDERFRGAVDEEAYVFQSGKTAIEHEQLLAGRFADAPTVQFGQRAVYALDYRLRAITFVRAYLFGLVQETHDEDSYVLEPLGINLPVPRIATIPDNNIETRRLHVARRLYEAMQYFCMTGPLSVATGDRGNPLSESNMATTLRTIEDRIAESSSQDKRYDDLWEEPLAQMHGVLNRPRAAKEHVDDHSLSVDMARFVLAVAKKSQDFSGYDHLKS